MSFPGVLIVWSLDFGAPSRCVSLPYFPPVVVFVLFPCFGVGPDVEDDPANICRIDFEISFEE